jgi:hypothetical protein
MFIILPFANVVNPDSMGSLDPDPNSRSVSRRGKFSHKNRKKLINFIFWSAGCSLLRAEGFSYSLNVLYRGLRISKLQFLIKKSICSYNFFQFLVIKSLDSDSYPDLLELLGPDPHWIRIHNTAFRPSNGRCMFVRREYLSSFADEGSLLFFWIVFRIRIELHADPSIYPNSRSDPDPDRALSSHLK